MQPAEVEGVASVGPACPECPAGWVGPVRSSPGAGGWVGPVSAAVSSGMSNRVAAASRIGTIRVEAATRAKPGPRALIRESHGPLPVGAAEGNPGQWDRVCVQEAVGCWHQGHPPARRRRVGGYRVKNMACRWVTELAVSQFGVRWRIRRGTLPRPRTGRSATRSYVPRRDGHTVYAQLAGSASSVSPAAKRCGRISSHSDSVPLRARVPNVADSMSPSRSSARVSE